MKIVIDGQQLMTLRGDIRNKMRTESAVAVMDAFQEAYFLAEKCGWEGIYYTHHNCIETDKGGKTLQMSDEKSDEDWIAQIWFGRQVSEDNKDFYRTFQVRVSRLGRVRASL